MGARMYMPKLGRFLAPDPLWEAFPSLTPYHFTYNNPISFHDNSGLAPEKEKGDAILDGDDDTPLEAASSSSGFFAAIASFFSNCYNALVDFFGSLVGGGSGSAPRLGSDVNEGAGASTFGNGSGGGNFGSGKVLVDATVVANIVASTRICIGELGNNSPLEAKYDELEMQCVFWAKYFEDKKEIDAEDYLYYSSEMIEINLLSDNEFKEFAIYAGYPNTLAFTNTVNSINKISLIFKYSHFVEKDPFLGLWHSDNNKEINLKRLLGQVVMHEFGHGYGFWKWGFLYAESHFNLKENVARWFYNTRYNDIHGLIHQNYMSTTESYFIFFSQPLKGFDILKGSKK